MSRNNLKAQFKEVYEQHSDAIFRHCLFRVRERQAALDLMQEAFMKTWNHLLKHGQVDYPRAFLYTVANNLIIDRSRKKKEASLEVMAETGFDPGERDRALERDPVIARKVHELLAAINPKYREAVQLRYFDDLSPKEIAKILGITENNASVRIHHGLEQLRKLYPHEQFF